MRAFLAVVLFPFAALAQAVTPDDPGFFQTLLDAVVNKNFWIAGAMVCGLLAWGAQKLLSNKFPELKGVFWTAVFGTLFAILFAFLNLIGAGTTVTWPIILAALKTAAASAPAKVVMQLALAWILSKIGFGKADPAAIKTEATQAGLRAANSVQPVNSKDLVNK